MAVGSMEKIEGEVVWVSIQPGGEMMMLDLAQRQGQVVLYPSGPGSEVTVDGTKVGTGDLLKRIAEAKGSVWAELYPLGERYGACLKAIFTTKKDLSPTGHWRIKE